MATMQLEYDPERLIEEIRRRPGIWDSENIEYRTKTIRYKLWTEIVKELLTNDVQVSKSEIRELVLQLQKKWKGIRDCYQKFITRPAKTKRPYLYSRQLQFLLKNSTAITNNEAGSSESEEGRSKSVWKPVKKVLLKRESSADSFRDVKSIDNDSYKSNDDLSIDMPVNKQSIGYKPVTEEFAFASVDSQSRIEQEDADKLFLLSLLPHIKSIPEEMRLNVKMDLMQVLRDANYHSASRKNLN